MVRAPVPRGAPPAGSVAGHLAHEVPGAWLPVGGAIAGLTRVTIGEPNVLGVDRRSCRVSA
jgi:hypothetical protein